MPDAFPESKVTDIIRQVFPNGTVLPEEADAPAPVDVDIPAPREPDISTAPLFPPDAFAVTALLLQRAGVYQHVISSENMNVQHFPEKSITISASDRDRISKTAKAWQQEGKVPAQVQKLWGILSKEKGGVFAHNDVTSRAKSLPKWCSAAYEIMATADEASLGAGFFNSKSEMNWINLTANANLEANAPKQVRDRHIRHHDNPCSMTSILVNQDVVCVQPKSRTPDVGCSLRNVSHNLALLPPRGSMKVHWLTPPARQPSEHKSDLRLLLVPYPYLIENQWFIGTLVCDDEEDGWGWFDVQQEWLSLHRASFLRFLDGLIESASSTGKINGIVFPELALDYDLYEVVAKHLRDKHESVDFFVSGSSRNCNQQTGNFALASHFYEVDGERTMATVSRPKHHRWSLDAGQLHGYELTKAFPKPTKAKDVRWWENIPLNPRSIHVNALRNSSVFTAMICEDLARSDPAHEPLRAVGSNLVFVLLMDGPQLEWRWSNRYSTGLAEDPGSSVLTITSRALMDRWNRTNSSSASWNIAIWKDEKGRAREISCGPAHQGVVITISGEPVAERTVDGRKSRDAFRWTMLGVPEPVSLAAKYDDLTKLFCESR